MIHTLYENPEYTIGIDKSKNRMYLSIAGFWKNLDMVKDYVPHLKEACKEVEPGFTLLADLSKMHVSPKEVLPVHAAAQKVMLAAGLKATAEVQENSFVKLQTSRVSVETAMNLQQFSNWKDAEQYLDSMTEENQSALV